MIRSRREFVSCASHLALAAAVLPASVLERWSAGTVGEVVAEEAFGRLEQVADGVWALISTPLTGDRTTLSNGGIVAGSRGVLAIEGFNTPEGARWLAAQSRALTGRWPTHVVLTHYHADHANGVAGYTDDRDRPVVRATEATREQVLTRNTPQDADRSRALQDAIVLAPRETTEIDLGSKTVRVIPREGHTSSDVTLELDEPSLVFCGDLFWNAMFPNYVDANPVALAKSVKALRRTRPTTYIPGHGVVAREADIIRYVAMLDEVEAAARAAHAKGLTAAQAGEQFSLPPSLGEWTLFNKVFFERAMTAWYRQLSV